MAVWRFNANGTVDTGFGGDGIVVHNNAAGGNGNDSGNAVVIDSSKRIVVVGSSTNGAGNTDMVIWRFDKNGNLDTTFSSDGIVVQSSAAGGTNGNDYGNAFAIDSSGRILVAGSSTNTLGDTDMVLSRFTTTGAVDTTFNGSGIVIDNGAAGINGDDVAKGISVDSQGRIIVAGRSTNTSGNTDMVVWRFNADGSLDIIFADYGIFVHNNAAGGGGDDSGNGIAVDAQDKILVGGSSMNSAGNVDMAVWRVFP